MSLRLLHVVPTYLPAVRYGGPIFSVHGLCKGLARRGNEVHVFTTSVDGASDSPVPLGSPVDLDGVQVTYFRVPALRRLFRSPAMATALARNIDRFDIVHAHSVFLWPTWAAARSAAKHRIPYVLSPRGMLVRDLVRRKSRWIKTAWLHVVERHNIEGAAALHATSQVEADELAQFGFRLPSVAVIPNGVDIPDTSSPTCPLSTQVAAVVSGPRYLLFLGRIHWKKGLDRLVAALARVPDVRLVIAGNDDEGYRAQVESLVIEAGVASRSLFLGPVYGEDKLALLRNAVALVAPSYSENFGNVVIEAMAAGCAVITTPEVGASALVRESDSGLVAQGEAIPLADAISRLVADPALTRKMGERGKRITAGLHAWDSVAASMESFYQKAIVPGANARQSLA